MSADLTVHFAQPLASPEAALFVLFTAGITALTAVAFVFWVGWIALRGLVMIMTKLAIWPTVGRRKGDVTPSRRACPDPVCRTINPQAARYCRHCGRMLSNAPAVA